MATTTKVSGYKIDFTTNTLIMNYKFAAAANAFGTPEYELVKSILTDFPHLKSVVKSGRETKSAPKNKRLTYENMEKYIHVHDNADELIEVFETVKAASQVVASPYKYVADWFKMQFPDYKKVPVFENGKLTVLPVIPPEVEEYKIKMAKAG